MSRLSRIIPSALAAAIVACAAVAAPASASEKFYSSVYSCGASYPSGHTNGYSYIYVNAAGGFSSNTYSYPGGRVFAVGTSHGGQIVSYADAHITSWGFDGCSYL